MSLTWNDANIGESVTGEGEITLRYFDTHPDKSGLSDSYTTIIVNHGMGFNSNIWKAYIPYLPPDTRLLGYNLRGYQGSSPSFGFADPEHPNVDAVKRDTIDLLGFVKYAIKRLGVPVTASDRKKGGIILLGWSRGCMPVIGLLANLSSPPTQPNLFDLPISLSPLFAALTSHLRAFILFEPPGVVCGLVNPAFDNIVLSIPPEQRGTGFVGFLKSSVSQDKVHLLDDATDSDSVAHDMGTWLGMTPEECGKVVEAALVAIPGQIGFGLMYCLGSVPPVLDAAAWLKERLEGKPNAVVQAIPGGDHFAMATIPEAFGVAVESVITAIANRL